MKYFESSRIDIIIKILNFIIFVIIRHLFIALILDLV